MASTSRAAASAAEANARAPIEPSIEPSNEKAELGDLLTSLARGAISLVWLDFFAYLGQVGAASGFERGRREWMLGLALAAVAATWILQGASRRSLSTAASGSSRTSAVGTTRRGPARISRRWIAALCLFAPALLLTPPGLLALRPTGIATVDAFVIALLPTSALLWAVGSTRTPFSSFAFGMLAGYATTEVLLLPALGWSATLGLWTIAWTVCEMRRDRSASSSDPVRPSPWRALLFAVLWGLVAGAAAVSARPLLFQHVSATRPGLCALVLVALIGTWAGAWFGVALRRVWATPWWATAAAGISAVALGLCFQNLARHSAATLASSALEVGDAQTIAWLALKQGWFYLGFPAVSLGALFCLLDARGTWTAALVLCGTCAGAWLGETLILPRWFDSRAGAPARLFDLAAHPPEAKIDEVAWNPDGIAARYRTVAAIDPADIVHWQARRWERDPSWKRLEEAEIRLALQAAPKARELWIVGHPGPAHHQVLLERDASRTHVVDPLPWSDGGRVTGGVNPDSMLWIEKGEGACVVMLAHPEQPSSFSLRATSTVLHALSAELLPRGGSLWVWCDPRALTPAGVVRELSSWASEFPAGRLYILQDGYAGPLFGLELGGHADGRPSEDIAPILVMSALVSEAVAASTARAPSLDWPALEWQAALYTSPFTLPDGDVLDAIAATLTTPVSRPIGRLFQVLGLHARAQVERPSFHTKWDRVRIDKAEIQAALVLLREHPDFDPTARQIGNIAQVLFEKRDYDLLFDLLREALELRPDVALYHHLLGRVRHELLDPEGAVLEYDLALALDPGSLTIKSELAHIHAERGRWPIAVALLEEVWAATTPPDPVIAKALGLGYLELGKSAQARTLLEFAWQKFPGDGEIRLALDRLDAQKH